MKAFADLYDAIDQTTSTNAKVASLVRYLEAAPPADAAWALFFLTGRRLKRLLPTRLLHAWTLELTGLPEWLVEESYSLVGDFAEAIALLLDRRLTPIEFEVLAVPADILPFEDPVRVDTRVDGVSLAEWIERRILPLRGAPDAHRRAAVLSWWSRLERRELFLLNKLLTGEFRVGVSHTLVVRAVAELAALPTPTIEHRLMGGWEPSAQAFAALLAPEGPGDDPSRPYPFCLASPLDTGRLDEGVATAQAVSDRDRPLVPPAVAALGDRAEWLAEWKWDGIRAQLIHRDGQVFLWSRGEELITDRFPEVTAAGYRLAPGTVLDGEVLAYGDGRPRPFADLQQRIGRQRRVSEVAADIPVVFLAYDILEWDGVDIREQPLRQRRDRLIAAVPATGPLMISEEIDEATWQQLAGRRRESRDRHVEGLMLKRWTSPYRPGRRRGDWWKWKVDPFTVDAVLIYAQPGSGRRASLFTDYTFGVWEGEELVPVAKAYSGLTDDEIDELDRWVRRHTTERFGPVSAVEQVHVFELGFERIAASTRHRSGVALRFPRILRWRRDKTPQDADTLATLRRLIR